jgi:hypothetical protein
MRGSRARLARAKEAAKINRTAVTHPTSYRSHRQAPARQCGSAKAARRSNNAFFGIPDGRPTLLGSGDRPEVKGEPRSLTKTTGEDALSRWSRCTSGNRKLLVAQQSSGFLRMLCKGSALVRRYDGERKARPRCLEATG